MGEPPPYREPGDDTGVVPTTGPSGMPRWVKAFIIVAIILVLALIVSRLLGVQHGPRRHSAPGAVVAVELSEVEVEQL